MAIPNIFGKDYVEVAQNLGADGGFAKFIYKIKMLKSSSRKEEGDRIHNPSYLRHKDNTPNIMRTSLLLLSATLANANKNRYSPPRTGYVKTTPQLHPTLPFPNIFLF